MILSFLSKIFGGGTPSVPPIVFTGDAKHFVSVVYPVAQMVEKNTGIPAILITAQAALESGWGAKAKGNNLFGIKAGKGWAGETIKILTTEYGTRPNVPAANIVSSTPTAKGTKWTIWDNFRKYNSIADSIADHANFLRSNTRYAAALKTTNPATVAKEIAKAGYSTAPDYYNMLLTMMNSVQKRLS